MVVIQLMLSGLRRAVTSGRRPPFLYVEQRVGTALRPQIPPRVPGRKALGIDRKACLEPSARARRRAAVRPPASEPSAFAFPSRQVTDPRVLVDLDAANCGVEAVGKFGDVEQAGLNRIAEPRGLAKLGILPGLAAALGGVDYGLQGSGVDAHCRGDSFDRVGPVERLEVLHLLTHIRKPLAGEVEGEDLAVGANRLPCDDIGVRKDNVALLLVVKRDLGGSEVVDPQDLVHKPLAVLVDPEDRLHRRGVRVGRPTGTERDLAAPHDRPGEVGQLPVRILGHLKAIAIAAVHAERNDVLVMARGRQPDNHVGCPQINGPYEHVTVGANDARSSVVDSARSESAGRAISGAVQFRRSSGLRLRYVEHGYRCSY